MVGTWCYRNPWTGIVVGDYEVRHEENGDLRIVEENSRGGRLLSGILHRMDEGWWVAELQGGNACRLQLQDATTMASQFRMEGQDWEVAVMSHRFVEHDGSLSGWLASRGIKCPSAIATVRISVLVPCISLTASGAAYASLYGIEHGVGFAMLLFVHELGHAVMMWLLGIECGPMVFLPFVGAAVEMKEREQARWLELVRTAQFPQDVLRVAPEELRANREVVLATVRRHGHSLKLASEQLRGDREVVLSAVTQAGAALEYASVELRADRPVVLQAVRQYGNALRHASAELRADLGVAMAAVSAAGDALRFAADSIRADPEVLVAAVERDVKAMELAPPELCQDRGVMLKVVKLHGLALKYASSNLRSDWELVLAAIRREGAALRYAGEDLHRDKDFLCQAVRANALVLDYARELRMDPVVLCAAAAALGLVDPQDIHPHQLGTCDMAWQASRMACAN